MKKTLLFLLAAISLIGCKSSDFSIDGNSDNKSMNGTKIFLRERVDREWKTIDSTVVENGKFVFKGIVDTAKIVYFTYEFPAENRVRQAFVLEAGKSTVAIDAKEQISIKGTPQNELLQAYTDEKLVFYKKAEAYFVAHNDSSMSIEKQDALKKTLEEMSKEEVAIDVKYSTDNVNTLVGTHIFMNSFYNMNTVQKESIINLLNDETKELNRIHDIIANVEIEKKVAVGCQYTDFILPTLAGDSLSLSQLVGKTDYVLIDFWASWCGPCMRSLPELKELYAKYKGARFEILGVSLDDKQEAWSGTIHDKQLTWKQVSDLKGWKCEGSRLYAVSSIPNTVLIDKNGKIVGHNLTVSELDVILGYKNLK